MTAHGPVTWELLRERWMRDRTFSGPSEQYDFEEEWDNFVHEHTKEAS